jgi:type I restriction enzyme M protein
MTNFQDKANFIWNIADYLRGDYKQAEYGKIILPFTVLRRLDGLLAKTKQDVLKHYEKNKGQSEDVIDRILNQKSGYGFFHNHHHMDFEKLVSDPNNIRKNLEWYIAGFSESIKEIFDNFRFTEQIEYLDKANLLYLLVKEFANIDLTDVDDLEMGYTFEHLIRKFAEASNETAGEHFTPREVIDLMVHLLFVEDDHIFSEGIIRDLYDPACGTGGMLSVSDKYFHTHNASESSQLNLYGQELNPESYAMCKADMMIKGQNPGNIKLGNSFTEDGMKNEKFHYMLSNPPFGVNWKKVQAQIQNEYETMGFAGRFGPGLPSVSDGSLLFLLHMISKMKPVKDGGSRLAIVFNGSPLFTGGAGSGVSNIRKWIIENDLLESITALPEQLFYNTGISTYIWVLTNRKANKRKGKIQLINAVGLYEKMKRSLGNKRNEIKEEQIEEITRHYGDFKETAICKIFDNEDFGYTRIQVDSPLRSKKGEIEKDAKGNPKPDTALRDNENIPLKDSIEAYFKREVLPHIPDAWYDAANNKIGYEINFTRYFYEYKPLRSLHDIKKDIMVLEEQTVNAIKIIIQA